MPNRALSRDMVRVDGRVFRMGSEDFYADEGPVHERRVESFWIDRYEVTNADYAEFVAATGYVTTAERELDPAEFEGADPANLVPGAMVFTPSREQVDLRDWRNWWRWEPGACWWRPFGLGSSIEGRQQHPVVHIAYPDAVAYTQWAGLRLPTEAEHEYAARGGLEGAAFAWGDDPYPGGVAQANSWLGRFPYDNRGVGDAAPVGSYPPNGYGLYDMIGNVWEWTSDIYSPRHLVMRGSGVEREGRRSLPWADPAAVTASPDRTRRVLKGGSHLCSPDYCLRFRPAARSPQTEATGMSHIGFRCARDADEGEVSV